MTPATDTVAVRVSSFGTRLLHAVERAIARITWRVAAATLAIALALETWSMLEWMLQSGPKLSWSANYISTTIVNIVIAFSMLATTFIADEFVAGGARRLPAYAAAVAAGSALGMLVQWQLHFWLNVPWRNQVAGVASEVAVMQPAVVLFEYLIWGTIIVWIYVGRCDALRAAARMSAARLQRADTQRRTLQARLLTLQAQVEPQFLFDTLARVRARYDIDPPRGSAMLGGLIAYLRAALPQLRDSSSNVSREVGVAGAYVGVMRANCGDDIEFSADVPEDLRDARMPPMVLLPLIDCLLVRRTERTEYSRTISVAACRIGAVLRVAIADGVRGFADAREGGRVDEIRQRLAALYGVQGRLVFEPSERGGTHAIIEIPYEPADGDHR